MPMVFTTLNLPFVLTTTTMLVVPELFLFLRTNILKDTILSFRVTLFGDSKYAKNNKSTRYEIVRKNVRKSGIFVQKKKIAPHF